MAVQMQTRRTESAERWSKALERAISSGLEVFQVSDSGERMVTSASQFDTLHRTDGRACTCAAGVAGDPVCQHRAVVRFVMGWLPEGGGVTSPSRIAATLHHVACRSCQGGRIEQWGVSGPIGWTYCDVCNGTGSVPTSQPAARIAA